MKGIDYKYMSVAQQAEIDALWPEHGEAITAYVKDCVCGYNIGRRTGSLLSVATVGIGAGAVYIGKKVYHKLKEKKEPTEKPGRVWEA